MFAGRPQESNTPMILGSFWLISEVAKGHHAIFLGKGAAELSPKLANGPATNIQHPPAMCSMRDPLCVRDLQRCSAAAGIILCAARPAEAPANLEQTSEKLWCHCVWRQIQLSMTHTRVQNFPTRDASLKLAQGCLKG